MMLIYIIFLLLYNKYVHILSVSKINDYMPSKIIIIIKQLQKKSKKLGFFNFL